MPAVTGGNNQNNVDLQINVTNNTRRGIDEATAGLGRLDRAADDTQDSLNNTTSAVQSLTQRFGPMVAGIASVGTGIALLTKAFGDFKETSAIVAITNAQIERMGFEADISREQIDQLVASTRNIEDARKAILGLTASNQLDPKLLPELFQLAKTAAQVEQLGFDNVATDIGKALTEAFTEMESLNGQLLFMTDAQLEATREMDRLGKSAEAQAFIIQKLRDKYGEIRVQDPAAIFDQMGIAVTLVSEKIGGLIRLLRGVASNNNA